MFQNTDKPEGGTAACCYLGVRALLIRMMAYFIFGPLPSIILLPSDYIFHYNPQR